ncbi:MAG: glycosyltransferase involved in cell wall biosynthesis [Hyphomicrobiaceae bacterium]|jgi:glycosyltransferase involved in cell wall biosynthesis
MSMPLVSIIIPCFNTANTVANTVGSVSAQSMRDFEIIAIDNNCTDNTFQILTDLAEREPRLRIIKQPVQGISAARNGGISAARGEFIALLDSDDL